MLPALLCFLALSGGVPQRHKPPTKPGHTPAKEASSSLRFGYEPLKRASSRQEIIAYYNKMPVSHVEAQRFQRNGKDLLCLTVDTGSGIEIVSAFAYLRHHAEWRLIYKHRPDRFMFYQFVPMNGTQIQIRGGFLHKPKEARVRVEYKLLHTIDLTKTAEQLLH